MTRILFVAHTGNLGGPAYSLLKLLKYLPPSYKSTVVMPGPGPLAEKLAEAGIDYYFNSLRLRHLPALAYSICRNHYDLIYANNFSYRSNIALFAAKLSRRPFIWHIREMVRIQTPVRYWLHHSDAVVAVSTACADLLRDDVPPEKLHVVHNGIDLDEFTLSREQCRRYIEGELAIGPEKTIIISLGNICERKNQLEAVEIVARLIRRFHQVHLCFLGRLDHSPEYVGKVKQRASELGIEEHIRWPGFRADVASLLQGADIFLHTSTIDPHPRSIIEAMAARLPVVAHRTGGIPETVVDGQTGLLAPLGDINGLVAAVTKLVANPTQRLSMGEQGRQRVEQLFTAERTACEIGALIERVLARKV